MTDACNAQEKAMFAATASLCPICLRRIDAFYQERRGNLFLVKNCPEHGSFRAPVWRAGSRRQWSMANWLHRAGYQKPPKQDARADDCPFACGLCQEHQQRTCTALIEVTKRCDLACPVCYADACLPRQAGPEQADEPSLARIAFLYDRIIAAGRGNIQLSGGEPTMRRDLAEIIALGRDKGFSFIQLNSNGLRLAADPAYGRELRRAGLSSVFLQFDGVSAATHLALRGRDLRRVKKRAIEHCAEAGLGVVLTATLVPGVNTCEIGDIIRYAAALVPTVRGVHFQPRSLFGRYPADDRRRLTLPELLAFIEAQTPIAAEHLKPPGCEHPLCSFHGGFIIDNNGLPQPFPEHESMNAPCRCDAATATPLVNTIIDVRAARDRSVATTARLWSPINTAAAQQPDDFDRILALKNRQLSISAMAFQDVWNLDLERLRRCCIHVAAPDGRLIPFCAWNLTAQDGRPLYRGASAGRPI
ncbi:MAG: radical SAM protein [Desulfobulbaceae bacterium]|nr:radical SAM protein [Desulfobulbaceae bacterium]